MADGSQLSNNVFTPGAAPDYLGHYAEILRSIPNYGIAFQQSAAADAQRAAALANYQLMKQKAQAFMELYPAFKQAQIAKLQAEAGTLPYKQALLSEQAALAKARAASLTPPAEGTKSQFADLALPAAPSSLNTPPAIDPNAPQPAAPAAPADSSGFNIKTGVPDPYADQ